MNQAPSTFQPLPGRDCGACTVCCVELEIDDAELHKPDEVACRHLGAGGGCSIYARRPKTCAAWYCGWRLINMADGLRPDLSGVLAVPEMCHEPGYQKGGLRLVAVGGASEALFQPGVIDLAGRCVAAGVPIFLSAGSGPRCKRALVNPLTETAVRAGDRAAFVAVLRQTLARMEAAFRSEAPAPRR